MRTIIAIVTIVLAAIAAGCAGRLGPYSTPSAVDRNTTKAERLTREAASVMDTDPDKAQALLRGALTADLYHGPAHNNLGVWYLNHNMLYEAANEFEWARKLMPGHPDPRMNLAVTLERAGRIDDALESYASALEVFPNHLASMQGLARLQLRYDRVDHRTPYLLEEIAMRGETAEWREWARMQQLRLDQYQFAE